MSVSRSTIVATALLATTTMLAFVTASSVGGDTERDKDPGGWEYRALERAQVEDVDPAPRDKRGHLPGMDTPRLARGLNLLGSEGWELTGIEPYHDRSVSTNTPGLVGPVRMTYAPTYVFKRRK